MIEVRYQADLEGKITLDEVVMQRGKMQFHLEQMSDNRWWMGLYDGKQSVHVILYAKRATIHGVCRDEGEKPPKVTGAKELLQ